MTEIKYKKIENALRPYFLKLDYFLTYHIFKRIMNKDICVEEIKNILVVENTFIGDLINATPVFKVLKENFKNSKITVMCLNKSKEVIENNKNVDNIIAIDNEPKFFDFRKWILIKKEVKKRDFQLAIILHHGGVAISLLLLLAKIKYRLGCTRTGILKGKGFFLNKKIYPQNSIRHIVEQNLDVLKLIPVKIDESWKRIEINCKKEEEEKIINKFNLSNKNKYVGVHIGTQHKSQRWQTEKWVEVINHLILQKNTFVILTGTENDLEEINYLLNKIEKKEKIIIAAGETNLRELFALVKQLNLIISIDTSAVHIAAAFNIPTITLYGPGNPETWHPWQKNAKWIIKDEVCTRCRQHFCIWSYLNKKKEFECMKSIATGDIIILLEKKNES